MPIPRPQLIDQNYTRMDTRHSWFLLGFCNNQTNRELAIYCGLCQMKLTVHSDLLETAPEKCPRLGSTAKKWQTPLL